MPHRLKSVNCVNLFEGFLDEIFPEVALTGLQRFPYALYGLALADRDQLDRVRITAKRLRLSAYQSAQIPYFFCDLRQVWLTGAPIYSLAFAQIMSQALRIIFACGRPVAGPTHAQE